MYSLSNYLPKYRGLTSIASIVLHVMVYKAQTGIN